jgi:excisionase family DNA binding protein
VSALAVTLTVDELREVVAEAVAVALTRKSQDDALTRPQVAALLGVHPKTVTRLVRKGRLRGKWVGRVWRFRRQDVSSYMSDQEAI